APDGTVGEVKLRDARAMLTGVFEREQRWKDRHEEDKARSILEHCLTAAFGIMCSESDAPDNDRNYVRPGEYDSTAQLIEGLHKIRENALQTFKIFYLFDHVCKLIERVEKVLEE
ncbi:hypothetical protein PFISCL1PPCAC_9229, partial [Pristionchus fissidentatus]